MNKMLVLLGVGVCAGTAWAKLPPPSDEAKAKAAEASAKAAYAAKVDAFKTCQYDDKAAAHYFKTHPGAPKPASAPACVDPGPYVSPTAAPATAGVPAAPAATSVPPAKGPAKKS